MHRYDYEHRTDYAPELDDATGRALVRVRDVVDRWRHRRLVRCEVLTVDGDWKPVSGGDYPADVAVLRFDGDR